MKMSKYYEEKFLDYMKGIDDGKTGKPENQNPTYPRDYRRGYAKGSSTREQSRILNRVRGFFKV
jgi:hypothetical protein